MKQRARRFVTILGVLSIGLAGWTVARAEQSTRSPAPNQVSTGTRVDGAVLFQGYCAPCHGEYGKGDGPLADFLADANKPPTDLTTIALEHDGTFPTFWVEAFIANRGRSSSRGRDAMPDWGRLLRSRSTNEGVYQLKLRNLVEHLRSIQVQ